ncbi:hypothetical protein BDW69DRAFT_149143 [Aspergillus filifer]
MKSSGYRRRSSFRSLSVAQPRRLPQLPAFIAFSPADYHSTHPLTGSGRAIAGSASVEDDIRPLTSPRQWPTQLFLAEAHCAGVSPFAFIAQINTIRAYSEDYCFTLLSPLSLFLASLLLSSSSSFSLPSLLHLHLSTSPPSPTILDSSRRKR